MVIRYKKSWSGYTYLVLVGPFFVGRYKAADSDEEFKCKICLQYNTFDIEFRRDLSYSVSREIVV